MRPPSSPSILLLMFLTILLLGAVAVWDERRESAAALEDFAAEQAVVARQTAAAFDARLGSSPAGASVTVSPELLAASVRAIEDPKAIVVLFQAPGTEELMTPAGHAIRSPSLESAMARRAPWARLTREEASALGLPPRMAMAGLAETASLGAGRWKIAVVTTALRLRDRQSRATWRLVLGFALVSAAIAGFAGLARANQKREIAMAKNLALAEAASLRDERLVRADKLATLGALATGIAHEVSTPLGVIVGRAEQLVPKVAGDERARRAVNVIMEQADRISDIIRAFLRLARGGTPSLEHVDPATLGRVALDLVTHRFDKARVGLTSHLPADLPKVACDPKLFEQVLVNLLLNACDACTAGGRVELSAHAADGRVAFEVEDDGEGISEEASKRATEPFFTTKSGDLGTGLGLAIAAEIVKHHRGDLSLSPRKGARGTRAIVTLSAYKEPDHG